MSFLLLCRRPIANVLSKLKLVYYCKGRHFNLLHHFPESNIVPDITCQSSKSCTSISDIFPLPVSFQINANTSHAPHIVLLHCYLSILANTCRNSSFSQYNLVLRALRSVRNPHHRIALLGAVKDSYNVDLLWLKGSEVIGSQSPKILTPDLVDPRDPLIGTLYKLPHFCHSVGVGDCDRIGLHR